MSFLEYKQFSSFSLNFKSVPFRSFQKVNLLLYAEANKMIDCSTLGHITKQSRWNLACLFCFFVQQSHLHTFRYAGGRLQLLQENPVLRVTKSFLTQQNSHITKYKLKSKVLLMTIEINWSVSSSSLDRTSKHTFYIPFHQHVNDMFKVFLITIYQLIHIKTLSVMQEVGGFT